MGTQALGAQHGSGFRDSCAQAEFQIVHVRTSHAVISLGQRVVGVGKDVVTLLLKGLQGYLLPVGEGSWHLGHSKQ